MSLTALHPPARYSGAWQKKPLRHLLETTDTFVHIVELVTSRGLSPSAMAARSSPLPAASPSTRNSTP